MSKVCTKCGIEKDDDCFRKIKSNLCKLGYYISGSCRECQNIVQREKDKKRRAEEPEYRQACRDRVKKCQKTDKGKISKKKSYVKYKEKNREYYLNNYKKAYQQRLERLKKDTESISDEYVITQLQNPHRKVKYTREYLKEHPEIIEIARNKILIHRLKIELEKTGKGICRKCKNVVPLSEFRKQKTTSTRNEHIIRMCKECRKQNSKECWDKYIIKNGLKQKK